VSSEPKGDGSDLEQLLRRLATERTELFVKANSTVGGLSTVDQQRLATIERELDDGFNARRVQRAARDAHRFSRDGYSEHRNAPRRTP
jgi:hypothetical protein